MDLTTKNIKLGMAQTKIISKHRDKLTKNGHIPNKLIMPLTLQFELTSKCNLKCKHCYNKSKFNNTDLLKIDDWVKLCNKLIENGGVFQVTLSGGEPLLLGDDLWKIMDILHNDGTIFNLISNGFLFNNEVLKKCKKYNFFWIQISIDNPNSQIHDEFRGKKGSWKKAAEAAYHIALSGIPLRIASTINRNDIGNLEKFVQMAINLGASYYIIGEVMPSGRAFENKELFLSIEDRNNFYEEINKLQKKYSSDINISTSGSQRVLLEYASSRMLEGAIIRPDGNVRLDCTCPFVIGNILKEDIIDIWKKQDQCWCNDKVKSYIAACDPISGLSNIDNYQDPDVFI